MTIGCEEKRQIVVNYGKNEKDTGATQVQIALLTARIKELTIHLTEHKKDFSAQWGIRKLVGQRRRLLLYLKRKNFEEYKKIIAATGIRGV
ncbi:30S ribosomal protein S15 [Candidatus Acetothermia bacterium]|jgi:small subunit ribosomal protein S15|nr:30S ribosomal protein S15 [Candidatus Acetothermia bacterium]MCI2425953.1 30S ribosomal protein S15 [Candidatus Acetothermia bacterium]MCI2427151.1 30S ribosomal protein S15 [Candidatus Acetothermia bacterium]MCI2428673.1 30S ribosomal protein S15 [Candidatus Acetothermia bacterium]